MLEAILSLPIEKKIGQLFFIGISGTEIETDTRKLIDEVAPGGVCLFARNIRTAEQTRKLLSDIREILDIEPFLSLDEEGGVVDRLRRITTPLPPANRIKNTDEAAKLAEITAEIVRILGFNLNFAPVVDVVDEKRSKFSNGLYSRSFGNSKEDVIELAGEYLNVLQDNGCIGCLKHFPGLGASEVDSHEELPQVNVSREAFFAVDLFPYINLLKNSAVYAVMIAHAAFPKLDLQEKDSNGKLLPSSLSFNFVTNLLRRDFGFDGLVITDDLEMGAIIKNYGIGEACVAAINAGADMPAVCADANAVRKGFETVLNAVNNGKLTEERLNESLSRIAYLKSKMQKSLPFDTDRLQVLSEKIADLNNKINYNYGG